MYRNWSMMIRLNPLRLRCSMLLRRICSAVSVDESSIQIGSALTISAC